MGSLRFRNRYARHHPRSISEGGVGADSVSEAIFSGGEDPTPWLEEDFSTYTDIAHFKSDPRDIYTAEYLPSSATVTTYSAIDTTVGYGTSDRSLRYDYPARPTSCGDFTIGYNMSLPAQVREVWVEAWVRWSSNWDTVNPNCVPPITNPQASNPDHKLLFVRVHNAFGDITPEQRFTVLVGNSVNRHYSINPPDTTGYTWIGGGPASDIWDATFHRVRVHARCSSALNVTDGFAKLWIDDTLKHTTPNLAINRTIYGIALGRNLNQGPEEAQSLWWGRIRAWNTDPGW